MSEYISTTPEARPQSPVPSNPTLLNLTHLPIWVTWMTRIREKKPTKVPLDPSAYRGAKTNDPTTWGTFAAARSNKDTITSPGACGVGIMLANIGDGHHLGGIDIDTCRDRVAGVIADWAKPAIELLSTYTEVSPSLTGVKCFFLYDIADQKTLRHLIQTDHTRMYKWTGEDHPPGFELNLSNRFFTVTGKHLGDTPKALRVMPVAGLERFVREIVPAFLAADPNAGSRVPSQKSNCRAASTAVEHTRDSSGSGNAFRLGKALVKEGCDYAEMVEGLQADASTMEWSAKQADERGFERIYDKAVKDLLCDYMRGLVSARIPFDVAYRVLADAEPFGEYIAANTVDHVRDLYAAQATWLRVQSFVKAKRQMGATLDEIFDVLKSTPDCGDWLLNHHGYASTRGFYGVGSGSPEDAFEPLEPVSGARS